MKYIETNEKMIDATIKIKELSDNISEQEMIHCNHYFVIQRDNGGYDGHCYERDPEVTCIFYGLTNKYMSFYENEFNEEQRKMNLIYVNYNNNAPTYGWTTEKEIPMLKKNR